VDRAPTARRAVQKGGLGGSTKKYETWLTIRKVTKGAKQDSIRKTLPQRVESVSSALKMVFGSNPTSKKNPPSHQPQHHNNQPNNKEDSKPPFLPQPILKNYLH
jgi:hypothetical protein